MSYSVSDKITRSVFRKQIRDVLLQDKRFKKMNIEELDVIVKDIEIGCNNEAIKRSHDIHPINWVNIKFREIYGSVFYKMIENLNPDSSVNSTHLIDKLYKKPSIASKLGGMNSFKLCPEKSKQIIENRNVRLNEVMEHKSSKRYPCPMCKAKKAQYQKVQLRSLDEGYNLSLTCMECGFRWIS